MIHTPHPHLEDRRHHQPKDIHKQHKDSLTFNQRMVVASAALLGSPWTIYVFCIFALSSLPAVLVLAGILPSSLFPAWLIAASFISLIAWVAQTFIQLVALAILQANAVIDGKKTDALMHEMFRMNKLQYKDSEVILEIQNNMHELLKENTQVTKAMHRLLKKK